MVTAVIETKQETVRWYAAVYNTCHMRSNVLSTSGFSSVTVSTKADAMNEHNFLSFEEQSEKL